MMSLIEFKYKKKKEMDLSWKSSQRELKKGMISFSYYLYVYNLHNTCCSFSMVSLM